MSKCHGESVFSQYTWVKAKLASPLTLKDCANLTLATGVLSFTDEYNQQTRLQRITRGQWSYRLRSIKAMKNSSSDYGGP